MNCSQYWQNNYTTATMPCQQPPCVLKNWEIKSNLMFKFNVTTSLLSNTVCCRSILYPERPPRQVSCLWSEKSTVIARNYDCNLWGKNTIVCVSTFTIVTRLTTHSVISTGYAILLVSLYIVLKTGLHVCSRNILWHCIYILISKQCFFISPFYCTTSLITEYK